MEPIIRKFEFLTPGFVHGAWQSQHHGKPELRGPSAIGHLRWWFSALYGNCQVDPNPEERHLFGTVSNKRKGIRENSASLFTIRVIADAVSISSHSFIPHKRQGGGSKNAINPRSEYTIKLLPRRGGPTPDQWEKLERALDTWIYCGAVGQRSNRGAGSLIATNPAAPFDGNQYFEKVQELLKTSSINATLLPQTYTGEKELRAVAGDFLKGSEFDQIGSPFGRVGMDRDDPFPKRKPSSLKLRAVPDGENLQILALWDTRDKANLRAGVQLLAEGNKEIGKLIQQQLSGLI